MIFFTPSQRLIVEAVAETMIPTDATGPGAKEAGVIYFIDRQLSGAYGLAGNMYMKGPFVLPGQKGPITVGGVSYSGGSAPARIIAGNRYQYGFNLRQFWQVGLDALEKYSIKAYGKGVESLDDATRTKVLQDLWNNVPTDFSGIIPQDFFDEMHDMVWAGFLTDPIYGGNRGMVGWLHTGFSGTNGGNFYGENLKQKDLMLADHPTRLRPASLAQLQQKGG
jgi:gluconate 2-dehydrogenase gamma chain